MADTQVPKVKLDWSRLLGFDQTSTTPVDADTAGRLTDPRLAKIGPKPTKGLRVAVQVGTKPAGEMPPG